MPRWQRLKWFQKLYLIATLSLVIHVPTAVALTLVALVVDFWPRFAHMWESLAGKAVVLVFYAAITNFVLPFAAGMVNNLTGLDASYFPYAHYTAILLSLPGWIFGISIAVLVLLQLLFPFFILAILGLRLIGIHSTKVFKNLQYPVITMCLRFALSLLLVVKGLDLVDQADDITAKNDSDQDPSVAAQNIKSSTESEEQDNSQQHTDAIVIVDSDGSPLMTGGYSAIVRQLLAHFIFYFEANSRSRCELSKNVRSVELNEYQHVEIRRDKSQTDGYQFIIKACSSPGIPTM